MRRKPSLGGSLAPVLASLGVAMCGRFASRVLVKTDKVTLGSNSLKTMGNLDIYRNKEGKIFLNVGSSIQVVEGFVNLDNHILLHFGGLLARFKGLLPKKYRETAETFETAKRKALVIQHDCRKRLFFPDGVVDHILSAHFLDYVFPEEMEKILKEFYRVSKEGATLHIVLPNLRGYAEEYLRRNEKGDALAADWFLDVTVLTRRSRGSLKYRLIECLGFWGLQHRGVYDNLAIEKRLQDCGYAILHSNETPSKRYRASDDHLSFHVVARKPCVQ